MSTQLLGNGQGLHDYGKLRHQELQREAERERLAGLASPNHRSAGRRLAYLTATLALLAGAVAALV